MKTHRPHVPAWLTNHLTEYIGASVRFFTERWSWSFNCHFPSHDVGFFSLAKQPWIESEQPVCAPASAWVSERRKRGGPAGFPAYLSWRGHSGAALVSGARQPCHIPAGSIQRRVLRVLIPAQGGSGFLRGVIYRRDGCAGQPPRHT